MAITHHFKGSCGSVYGYYAYIEDSKLVIGESWPHEGGEIFRGEYKNAAQIMKTLKSENTLLHRAITKYFNSPTASQNLPHRTEAKGPDLDQAKDTKCDTDQNKAIWEYSEVDPIFICSNCGYAALNDFRGRSTASKFCPHCGKYMTNHQQEDD